MPRGIYLDTKDSEELYDFRKRISESDVERPDEIVEEKPTEKIRVVRREATPAFDAEGIRPLKRAVPKIMGNLFDRVTFLKERMEELRNMMETRRKLHEEIVSEIRKDIEEKEGMAAGIADIDQRRNIKLDVSVLRREKRHEMVQFWKDLTELQSELRQIIEEYKSESKITDIFKTVKGE